MESHEAPLLSPDDAAQYLGVKRDTLAVWRCTRRYDIPFIKVGRKVRYRRSDLDAWLDSRRVQSRHVAANETRVSVSRSGTFLSAVA